MTNHFALHQVHFLGKPQGASAARDNLTVALHRTQSLLQGEQVAIVDDTQGIRQLGHPHRYITLRHHLEDKLTAGYGLFVFFCLT